MCGRFTLTWEEWRRVAETLRIDDACDVAASYRPRFNIAPTDQHFIVTSEFEHRRVQRARWGLVNRQATDIQKLAQLLSIDQFDLGCSAVGLALWANWPRVSDAPRNPRPPAPF